MKNIQSQFIFLMLFMTGTGIYAQKVGIQAGINLSNVLIKDTKDTYSDDFSRNTGFSTGVTLEKEIGKLLTLEVGAIIDSKGYKEEIEDGILKTNLLYADMPVLLKFGPRFGPLRVYAIAGPYAAAGFRGREIGKPDRGNRIVINKISWGNTENDDFRIMDYGAKIGGGADVSHIYFSICYSFSLSNISPATNKDYTGKNRSLGISAGYRF